MEKKDFIDQLLHKIKHSEIVYHQASKSVHSTITQKELTERKLKREQYLKELMDATDNRSTPGQHSGGMGDFAAKIWLMINDLLIQRNVPSILISCVEADKELLQCYAKAEEHNLDEKVSKLIIQRRSEIQRQTDDFQKRIEGYPGNNYVQVSWTFQNSPQRYLSKYGVFFIPIRGKIRIY